MGVKSKAYESSEKVVREMPANVAETGPKRTSTGPVAHGMKETPRRHAERGSLKWRATYWRWRRKIGSRKLLTTSAAHGHVGSRRRRSVRVGRPCKRSSRQEAPPRPADAIRGTVLAKTQVGVDSDSGDEMGEVVAPSVLAGQGGGGRNAVEPEAAEGGYEIEAGRAVEENLAQGGPQAVPTADPRATRG